jgi:hypothetical protein
MWPSIFYGGRASDLVRRAECEFRVQRCRIGSQRPKRTIVAQFEVLSRVNEFVEEILDSIG